MRLNPELYNNNYSSSKVKRMGTIEDLNWRYATKVFSKKKIPQKDLDELLETLRLAPSSFGLEPWKFIVVSDEKTREKLREAAWGQSQVTDASHLIVLCIRKNLDEKYVKNFIERMAKTRNTTTDSLKGYEKMLLDFVNGMTPAAIEEWSKKQVYLALGVLLTAAAQKRIDAGPMEGFNPAKFDEILGLKDVKSTVICALGYRGEDKYAAAKKVRLDRKDAFVFR
jgi:nitroreductase/dihydropteridine reductase